MHLAKKEKRKKETECILLMSKEDSGLILSPWPWVQDSASEQGYKFLKKFYF